jgi:hypothetical protein
METKKEGLCDKCTDPMDCGSWNTCFVENRELVAPKQEEVRGHFCVKVKNSDAVYPKPVYRV